MKLQAYVIRDLQTETYAAPFFVPSDGVATRLLTEMVSDKRSDLGKYPKDFVLYSVGTYNTDTALMSSEPIRLVCNATACLPKPDPREIPLPLDTLNGQHPNIQPVETN